MPKENSTAAIAERYSVRCRYCGQKNSVKEDYKNGDAVCGRCRLPLSNAPHKKFADLSKHEYVHPADSKRLPRCGDSGIDTALKKLLSAGRIGDSRTFGERVKLRRNNARLHAKLQIACTTLGSICRIFYPANPM